MVKGEISALEEKLETHDLALERDPENFDAGAALPLLKTLVELQREGRQVTAPELAALTQGLRDAGIGLVEAQEEPEAEPEEPEAEEEPGPEAEEDFESVDSALEWGPVPDIPPSYALAPLAQGILIYDALLTEAKAGYMTGRIEELEAVLGQEFDGEEKMEILAFASQYKDEAGLPDVGGGYQQAILKRDGR
jgi:hypothetical protein